MNKTVLLILCFAGNACAMDAAGDSFFYRALQWVRLVVQADIDARMTKHTLFGPDTVELPLENDESYEATT